MKKELININISNKFINTIIKSELLKKYFKINNSPLLLVLYKNNDNLTKYMQNKGWDLNLIKKMYNIDCDIPNVIHNNFTQEEINNIIEEYLNKPYFTYIILNGNTLTENEIYKQEIYRYSLNIKDLVK